jgi:hypothetical protein
LRPYSSSSDWRKRRLAASVPRPPRPELPLQVRPELSLVARDCSLRALDLAAQIHGQRIASRSGLGGGLVERRRSARVAGGGEEVSLHDERLDVAWLHRERAIESLHRGRGVALGAASERDTDEGGGIGLAAATTFSKDSRAARASPRRSASTAAAPTARASIVAFISRRNIVRCAARKGRQTVTCSDGTPR